MDRIRRAEGRGLVVRVVAPAVCLWGLILGAGYAITGPLARSARAENAVNEELAAERTSVWNNVTMVWSHIGNTSIIIGLCLVVAALLLWRSRDWRLAVVPALAILLQAIIFASTSSLIDRERPPVPKLDVSPPTTSYPSGHVGATTGLYLAFALIALRIKIAWRRWLIVAVCLTMPVLVAYARLYRGMHHLTDVIAAAVNGIVCAVLAYGWYRHRRRRAAGDRPPNDEVVERESADVEGGRKPTTTT